MEERKWTKKEIYNELLTLARTGKMDLDEATLEAFCVRQIAILDNKEIKAKELAAKKRSAGDELTKAIEAVLTDDYEDLCDGECSFFNGKIKHQDYKTFFWYELDYITMDQLTDKAIAAIIRNSNTWIEKEIDELDSKTIMDLYSDGKICEISELNV